MKAKILIAEDDPNIRLGLIAMTLITGPVMILLYLLTGWLAPRQ